MDGKTLAGWLRVRNDVPPDLVKHELAAGLARVIANAIESGEIVPETRAEGRETLYVIGLEQVPMMGQMPLSTAE